MIDKDEIINVMKKRAGMDNVDLETLYQDSISDIIEFTHRTRDELENLAIESLIKDLMAFRFNTLATEGITAENNAGVSTTYTQDLPDRIKRKLRSYRKLNYERK